MKKQSDMLAMLAWFVSLEKLKLDDISQGMNQPPEFLKFVASDREGISPPNADTLNRANISEFIE